jgi:hypothetical protein
MKRLRTVGLLCVIGLFASVSAAAQQPSKAPPLPSGYQRELDARTELERAEELARGHRYADAQRAYKQVAEEFTGTAAAAIAERRSAPSAFLGGSDVVRHGPTANRVDIVLMGDGYELDHLKAFEKLADDVPPIFERQDTFREYYSYFNFIRADLVSAEAGVDGFGREFDTALGGHTRGTIEGHVAVDPERVRAMLRELPDHDDLAVAFVRRGILGTGSLGVATVGGMDAKVLIHEFGHAFCGLHDEYVKSNYEPRDARPWKPEMNSINVAGTDDPKRVPWAHWIAARHPSIGVYEGAAGQVRDVWKPTASGCVMDDGEFFCPVCREELVLRIYSLVDPIDGAEPEAHAFGSKDVLVLTGAPIEIQVRVMKPATHNLEVRWWVLPPERLPHSAAPGDSARDDTGRRWFDRRERGRLTKIVDRPRMTSRNNPTGVHTLRLLRSEMEQGRYRVICRVRDTTRLRDEEWPWVLKDEQGVLESERAWWVYVE